MTSTEMQVELLATARFHVACFENNLLDHPERRTQSQPTNSDEQPNRFASDNVPHDATAAVCGGLLHVSWSSCWELSTRNNTGAATTDDDSLSARPRTFPTRSGVGAFKIVVAIVELEKVMNCSRGATGKVHVDIASGGLVSQEEGVSQPPTAGASKTITAGRKLSLNMEIT